MNKYPVIRRYWPHMLAAGVVLAGVVLLASRGEDEPAATSPAPPTPTLGSTSPGTGSTPQPPKPISECTFAEPRQWLPLPREFKGEVPRYAKALGVSNQEIEQGLGGPALCSPGIPTETFEIYTSVAQIHSIPAELALGSTCLAIGSEVKPAPGAVSYYPIVLCPALPVRA